jgi:hemerythrin superfamily protein
MAKQIYDVLKQEHKQVSELLKQMTEGEPSKEQINELYMMLEAHTQAEEKTLYQDLNKSEETHELVLEAIEEHHVADVLLGEIREMNPSDERTKAKLKVLKESIEHHVHEEEDELFPKAQQIMDGQWAEEMAQQFQQQEQQIKQQLQ